MDLPLVDWFFLDLELQHCLWHHFLELKKLPWKLTNYLKMIFMLQFLEFGLQPLHLEILLVLHLEDFLLMVTILRPLQLYSRYYTIDEAKKLNFLLILFKTQKPLFYRLLEFYFC